jgi:hypothetical protein
MYSRSHMVIDGLRSKNLRSFRPKALLCVTTYLTTKDDERLTTMGTLTT